MGINSGQPCMKISSVGVWWQLPYTESDMKYPTFVSSAFALQYCKCLLQVYLSTEIAKVIWRAFNGVLHYFINGTILHCTCILHVAVIYSIYVGYNICYLGICSEFTATGNPHICRSAYKTLYVFHKMLNFRNLMRIENTVLKYT